MDAKFDFDFKAGYPQKFQEKTVNITENGTQVITPDEGYGGISKITIVTNVQGG